MAKVYGDMIKYGKINTATGEAWKLSDVPERFRAAVEAYLAQ